LHTDAVLAVILHLGTDRAERNELEPDEGRAGGIRCCVSEALRAGFQIYDQTSYGYLLRTRTSRGWALAVVHLGDAR
jgi:hypothetical protein